jgi:hypothetical protein
VGNGVWNETRENNTSIEAMLEDHKNTLSVIAVVKIMGM